jgi:hypothetical protein
MRKLVLYMQQARAEAHMQLYGTYRYGYRGVDGWMRGHNDIQATYNGMV